MDEGRGMRDEKGMKTDSQPELEALFAKHGYTDFKWMDPKQIVTAQWVRMKCEFGCTEYGKCAACPPNNPSVPDCRRFFDDYSSAVVFHFEKAVDRPEDRHPWSRKVNIGLSKLEREVFISGYRKAFLLFMDSCPLCDECVGRKEDCKNPRMRRPSPESMAVDVFATVRPLGFPIEVLSNYSQTMNRYAILLVE
jgi:predicted metal-binding protein